MVRDVREELYPLKKHCCIGILAQEAALSSIPNQRLQVSVMSHHLPSTICSLLVHFLVLSVGLASRGEATA